MVADKAKKAKLGEKSEADNSPLNEDLVLSIEKLQELQEELERINEEASDKVLEVEQKYNEVRKPVYERRNDIIKTIPDFWLTAFLSHPALGVLMNEEDQKIFKHLTSVDVEDNKDVKSGFSITLKFESNPYFENDKLIKTFSFLTEGTTKIDCTPIKWKEGMGISKGTKSEKKGKKRSLPEESFFSWFCNGAEDNEAMDDMQDEIAEIIKEDIWPNPLAYFNSEEGDFDQDDGDNEVDDSDGEDDDDENNDVDDDEENGDDDEDGE